MEYSISIENIRNYIEFLIANPYSLIILIIDLAIVIYLTYRVIKMLKKTRASQLLKGILILIAVTILSEVIGLTILNYILTSFMTYGVVILIITFQPEIRRMLERLGTGKISRFLGLDRELRVKAKETIYKIVIAAQELASTKTGGLIVIENEIKLKEISETGVIINSEISPQLLVNIFSPKTPLHDGAIIIADNKILSAACLLPLASGNEIAKKLGTRHRAGIGISKETDALVVIISEETGKISIAKDGTLYADLDEPQLKKILIKNFIEESSTGDA